MAEEWIRYESGVQSTGIFKLKINEQKITACIQPIGSVLTFPLGWEVNTDWKDKGYHWEIVSGNGSLKWSNKPEEYLALSLPIYPTNGRPYKVDFVLNPIQAEILETLRVSGDAMFLLNITFQIVARADVSISRSNIGADTLQRVVVNEFSMSVNLPINIPKSVYEKNVLPGLGLRGLTSLTITIPPGVRELLAPALYELDKAQETLYTAATEAQFESVVMQCRNAINALLNQFHLELPVKKDGKWDTSFASRVDAFVEQYLKQVLSNSQAKSVGNNLKELWHSYSAATKPGPAHHSKAYATFALHQAASAVRLVSDVLWTKQKK